MQKREGTDAMDADVMMTTDEVATMLKLCNRTIRRMHAAGVLTGSRTGQGDRGPLRFRRTDVEAYLEQTRGK